MCSIGVGLGRVDQKGVTVTSGQSSYVGRGGCLTHYGCAVKLYNVFLHAGKVILSTCGEGSSW